MTSLKTLPGNFVQSIKTQKFFITLSLGISIRSPLAKIMYDLFFPIY